MTNKIALAQSDEEITNCFAVMVQLRPYLKPDEFLPTVKRLSENAGFQMAYLSDGEVKAVAGFRVSEWLAGGRYLEIEDLAAKSGEQSKGYGSELFDWLFELARSENCCHLKLVSNVTRFDAHRFYLNKRMNIGAHYFTLDLEIRSPEQTLFGFGRTRPRNNPMTEKIREKNLKMLEVILKRFETPDETREFEKGKFEIVRIGGMTVGRASYEPGWKWSQHVAPTAGVLLCAVEHIGMVLQGRATAAMPNGSVIELAPGDLFYIPPEPHDSWVVGDEPYISLHFLGTDNYAK